jgi:hypothetical protein
LTTLFLSLLLSVPPPMGDWVSYQNVMQAAVDQDRPLVVFCDMDGRKVAGALCVYREKVEEVQGRASIMIYVPDGRGWLAPGWRLDPDADDGLIQDTIRALLKRTMQPSPQAAPVAAPQFERMFQQFQGPSCVGGACRS